MSYEIETIRRYMREKYGYEADLAEIAAEPRPERKWQLAIALAYFRKQNHFERVEDAPPGIEWITVADGKRVRNYEWRLKIDRYCYMMMNDLSRRDFDAFYGD